MFKTILVIVCLLTPLTIIAADSKVNKPPQITRSSPNIQGGSNFYSNRGFEGRTTSSLRSESFYGRKGIEYRQYKTPTGSRYQNFKK